jgi:hypothetical protein
VGTPVFVLTRYFIFVAEKSSAIPYSAFTIGSFPFFLVLIVYAALFYIGITLTKNARTGVSVFDIKTVTKTK